MSLENDIINIIRKIENISTKERLFLNDKLGEEYKDIRYSLYYFNEIANQLENLRDELLPVNEQLGYAYPTPRLIELRDELVTKYEQMYDLFEQMSKKINNN